MLQQRVQMIQIINIFVGLLRKKNIVDRNEANPKSVIIIYWLILMTMKLIENLI